MSAPNSVEYADAIVVGTRCAGSAAAIALATAGRHVIGLDSSRFPSDALSTHLLWPAGVAELHTLGALDRVRALGAPPLPIAMAVAVEQQYTVRAPYTPYEGIDYAMCVRRTGLDASLVATAREAGAEIRERSRVTELVWEDGRVVGVRYTDADNVFREIRAPLTIGADGRSSTVASLVGVRDSPYLHTPSGRNCFYGYWRDNKSEWRDTAAMWRVDDLLGTAFPCDDGLVLCLLQPPVDKSPQKVTRGVEEFYRDMVEQIPGLNDRLRGCELVGKVRSGLNIASYFRRSAGPGWALAGDAGHFKDPVTAQGIRDALHYGRLLGESTGSLLEHPIALDAQLDAWEQRRLRECIDIFQWTNRQARGEPLTPLELELYRAADDDPDVAVGLIEVYSRLRTPNNVVSPARLAKVLARGVTTPATSRLALTKQLGREIRDAAAEWSERRVTLPGPSPAVAAHGARCRHLSPFLVSPHCSEGVEMNETGGTTPGFNRRDVLRAAIVGGAAAAAATALPAAALPGTAGTASATPKPLRQTPILPKPGRSVAIFGGGMAGLSAAHELSERGYAVTVYEPSFLGGKARSMGVPGTAAGGRLDLPGEHGFRFFPGCYQHVPDTMSRIPFPGNPNGVANNLRPVESTVVGLRGMPAIAAPFGVSGISQLTPESIEKTLITAVGFIPQLPPQELAYFVKQMMMWFTSSEERRFGQWEHMTWEQALKAEGKSQAYRDYLVNALTRITVAAKPHVSSARTIATIGEALVLAATGLIPEYKGGADRILNRPTNEAWIDPWVDLLRSRGVQFVMGQRAVKLNMSGGRISGVTLSNASGATSTAYADHYVASMPVDKAQPLITDDIMNADPHLAGIHKLYADWMVGIQFYLTRQSGLPEGHIAAMGSPWALTGLRQAPMWAHKFETRYGDGTVVECLSVDVSDWDTPGILFGKTARQCTKEEVHQEIWAQLKMWLNTGRSWLRDEDVHSWHLDPGVTWSGGGIHNETPLLVNTVGSWDWRPDATTAIPNLFIGGDHVRTHIDLPTMEAANESGRAAANGIMNAAGDPGPRAGIFPLVQLPIFDAAKKIDADRFRAGQPHLLDG